MLILGKRGGKFGPKRVQNGRGYISPDCKPQFFKENHKIGFYTNKTQYDWFPGKSQNSKKLKKRR